MKTLILIGMLCLAACGQAEVVIDGPPAGVPTGYAVTKCDINPTIDPDNAATLACLLCESGIASWRRCLGSTVDVRVVCD